MVWCLDELRFCDFWWCGGCFVGFGVSGFAFGYLKVGFGVMWVCLFWLVCWVVVFVVGCVVTAPVAVCGVYAWLFVWVCEFGIC